MNHVADILDRSKTIHLSKRADYTTKTDENPYENFQRSSLLATWFPSDYVSFAVLIGTKLARLASLLTKEKLGIKPNNESIDDSFLDLVTYCALFYGYWKSKQEILPSGSIESPKIKSCFVHEFFNASCPACVDNLK